MLEKLRGSNCPPTKQIKFDLGPFALAGSPPPADGTAEAFAPRRRVLDKILVDAAVDAGAELRERFTVEELTTDGTTITGIRGRYANGAKVTKHARIVGHGQNHLAGGCSAAARITHARLRRTHPLLRGVLTLSS